MPKTINLLAVLRGCEARSYSKQEHRLVLENDDVPRMLDRIKITTRGLEKIT
jgi:hypothetical protein